MYAEPLEPRRHLSASVLLKGNQLRVFGDPVAANTIVITQDPVAGTTTATLTPEGQPPITQAFPTRKVRSLRIQTGSGDDTITVGSDAAPIRLNTYVIARQGADLITTSSGRDTVFAGAGNDTVFAGSGNDQVNGDDGQDDLSGGAGDDTLKGGDGDDFLTGDSGNDRLYGQDDDDTLHGSAGRDSFYVSARRRNDADIEDFDRHERDRILYVFENPWPF